jgi:putative ABC transport system ATP-binding protein
VGQSGPPAAGQPSGLSDGRQPGAAIALDDVTLASMGAESAFPPAGLSIDVPAGQSVAVHSQPRETAIDMLDAIAGLRRPRSGQLWVDDLAVHRLGGAELNHYRAHRGLVSMRFPLLPSLSITDNVLAAPAAVRAPGAAAALASRLLELTGAAQFTGPVERLPVEEQWRVMIARALVPSPRLLLAEDPAAGLDSGAADRVLDVLVDMHAIFGFTLVLIAGRPASAVRCQRRVVLTNGTVTEDEMTDGDDAWTRDRIDRIG